MTIFNMQNRIVGGGGKEVAFATKTTNFSTTNLTFDNILETPKDFVVLMISDNVNLSEISDNVLYVEKRESQTKAHMQKNTTNGMLAYSEVTLTTTYNSSAKTFRIALPSGSIVTNIFRYAYLLIYSY